MPYFNTLFLPESNMSKENDNEDADNVDADLEEEDLVPEDAFWHVSLTQLMVNAFNRHHLTCLPILWCLLAFRSIYIALLLLNSILFGHLFSSLLSLSFPSHVSLSPLG